MSSQSALPLIAAVRKACLTAKYGTDPADEFLVSLHKAGFEVVPIAAIPANEATVEPEIEPVPASTLAFPVLA